MRRWSRISATKKAASFQPPYVSSTNTSAIATELKLMAVLGSALLDKPAVAPSALPDEPAVAPGGPSPRPSPRGRGSEGDEHKNPAATMPARPNSFVAD